ncbi:response regulator [Aquibacillus saliphilus]|uniref:response regulator n=1 Tax=Aquibacillus saliphilus TaxID=1909422 RepID=UPI0034E25970
MAKILIVDDAKFMRITLSNILQSEGHDVIGEAENGKRAIELYEKLQPDLVTMDITMPEMNGLAALEEIISRDNNAKIIMCSAMGQQKLVVKAIELGAKDFLAKPFEENRVLESVNRILK